MARIVLMGMPGVGKGTYGKFLTKDLKIPQVILGDEVRQLFKENQNSPFFQKLADEMRAGAVLNDGLVWVLLNRALKKIDTSRGLMLDGFPRTEMQAHLLELSGININLVAYIKQHERVVVDKMLGRRVCEGCGSNYNVADIEYEGYSLPPQRTKVEGKCDSCGGNLITRKDDTHEVIKRRIQEFTDNNDPIEKFYRDRGTLFEFFAYKGVDDYPRFLQEVKNKLRLQVQQFGSFI